MADTGLKLGKIAQPVRVALSGRAASPGIFEIIAIIGKADHAGAPATGDRSDRTRGVSGCSRAVPREKSLDWVAAVGYFTRVAEGSSSGRTTGSGPVNLGSNPSPSATDCTLKAYGIP